jgi:hypothetical protein
MDTSPFFAKGLPQSDFPPHHKLASFLRPLELPAEVAQ